MATSTLALQRRLVSLGFDPGPRDGVWGPRTLAAVNAALDRLAPAPTVVGDFVASPAWMPWAKMDRIIWHWTAGTNKANSIDKKHYHVLIEGDGKLIRGDHSIDDNEAPIRGAYAAHTLNCNTGSIGVSLCGMRQAKESPFQPGPSPITREQWEMLSRLLAELCKRYAIPVLNSTVLSHAEVQGTLGIKQRNKWDITRLPWDRSVVGATQVGNQMRAMVKALL